MDINEVAILLEFKTITYEDWEEVKAGDVLKKTNGRFELVGNINEQKGGCDCCSDDYDSYYMIAKDAFEQLLKLMKGGSGNELS